MADIEGYGKLRVPFRLQTPDLQTTLLTGRARVRVEMIQVTAHHHPDDPVMSDLVADEGAGITAVAQHDNPVRQVGNLNKPVRDINDADALRLQLSCNPHQPGGLS